MYRFKDNQDYLIFQRRYAMPISEFLTSWLGENMLNWSFDSARKKFSKVSSDHSNFATAAEIKSSVLQKYGGYDFYNDFDRFITMNKCIEMAVSLSLSANPTNQRLLNHFVDYFSKMFIGEHSCKSYKNSDIVEAFDFIKKFAITKANSQIDPELQKAQIPIFRETEAIKDSINRGTGFIAEKLDQLPAQVLTEISESQKCNSDELQPYYYRIEQIKRDYQDAQLFEEAARQYSALYSEIAIKFTGKHGSSLAELNCSLLCSNALCYSNIGKKELAKQYLKEAEAIISNKQFRDAFANIALQGQIQDMYSQAIQFMEINLAENPDDLDSMLLHSILAVFVDATAYNSVIEKLKGKLPDIEKAGKQEKYYEYTALIEQVCGNSEKAIEGFNQALNYGYNPTIAKLNIASAYYSMAVKDVHNDLFVEYRLNWKYLNLCYSVLEDLLKNLPQNDLVQLILPEMLKLYLNVCMLIQRDNTIFEDRLLVQEVFKLDYNSQCSFILTTPNSIAEQRGYLDKLNEADRTLWNIHNDLLQNHDDIAEEIAWNGLTQKIFPKPELIYDLLLQIALKRKDVSNYLKYRDSMMEQRLTTPSIYLMDAFCQELEGDIETAKTQIDDLIQHSYNFGELENAIRFYRRNKFFDEAIGVIRRILRYKQEDKTFILHPELYYDSIFQFVFESDFNLCREIVGSIKDHEISAEKLHQMKLQIASYMNDYYTAAQESLIIYEKTNEAKYLLYAALSNFDCGNFQASEQLLGRLVYSSLNQDERWKYNYLYSKIALMKDSSTEAFEYAKKAHNDNLDRPKHPSHAYYMAIAIRSGHTEEGLSDTLSYQKDNPVAVNYIKAIASEVDENGNATIPSEFTDYISQRQKSINQWKSLYKHGRLGIYQIFRPNNTGEYASGLYQLAASNDKIYTFRGNYQVLANEVDVLKKNTSIVVDVLSLIILAHLNALFLLEHYSLIYLGYSSFRFLLEDYVIVGSIMPEYKKVLDWINDNHVIKVADGPILTNNKMEAVFPDQLWGSINVSAEKQLPLLYGDCVEPIILGIKEFNTQKINLVSINALARALEDEDESRNIYCNLMQSLYFVNFEDLDILYWIEKHNSASYQTVERFLTCTSTADVMSFARVYENALIKLKEKNMTWAREFAVEVVKNAVRLQRKNTYSTMVWEDSLSGKLDANLEFVKEHKERSLKIHFYISYIQQCIRNLFPDDTDLAAELDKLK